MIPVVCLVALTFLATGWYWGIVMTLYVQKRCSHTHGTVRDDGLVRCRKCGSVFYISGGE